MPFLVVFMLLFIGLALVWVIGAGLLFGTLLSRIPNLLDKALVSKSEHCACHFPFKHPA